MSSYDDHVVLAYTHGSYTAVAMEPGSLQEARDFIADPPPVHAPRGPQDTLRIFELTEVD